MTTYTITTIDVPGSTLTEALSINAAFRDGLRRTCACAVGKQDMPL
jgi:hypothetical protein